MKMTIDDILRLIANDEYHTLELKKTTGELKDGMHAACAFLNTDGGWLIFGIAPHSSQRELSTLQSLGILYREGSDKSGKWVVNLSTKV